MDAVASLGVRAKVPPPPRTSKVHLRLCPYEEVYNENCRIGTEINPKFNLIERIGEFPPDAIHSNYTTA